MCDDLECVVSYAWCGPSVRRLWQVSPGLFLEPRGVGVWARVALCRLCRLACSATFRNLLLGRLALREN